MYVRIANIPITLKISIITLINMSSKLFKGKYDMSKSEGINNTHSHIIMSLNSFFVCNISFNFLYSSVSWLTKFFYLITSFRLSSAFFIGLYTNTCKHSPTTAVALKIILIIGKVHSRNIGKCSLVLIVEVLTPIIKMKISKGKFLINMNPPIHYHFYFTIKRNKCMFSKRAHNWCYVNYIYVLNA